MRLQAKTAMITGAASGIGRETAERFAEEGATVCVTDVDESGAEDVAAAIRDAGGEAFAERLDVTDEERFQDVVDDVVHEHGLDVLVNNAGTGHPPAYVEDTSNEVRDFVIDVNLNGVWNGCQAALPTMKQQGSGAIVNVGSLASILGLPKQSLYSITKAGVLNFTRVVAAEAGSDGVRANAVLPGFIDTPMSQSFFEGHADPEEARRRTEAQYPLKRIGEPEEVAAAITFLASDDASFVTGHGLVVDGGFSTS